MYFIIYFSYILLLFFNFYLFHIDIYLFTLVCRRALPNTKIPRSVCLQVANKTKYAFLQLIRPYTTATSRYYLFLGHCTKTKKGHNTRVFNMQTSARSAPCLQFCRNENHLIDQRSPIIHIHTLDYICIYLHFYWYRDLYKIQELFVYHIVARHLSLADKMRVLYAVHGYCRLVHTVWTDATTVDWYLTACVKNTAEFIIGL